MDGRPMDGVYSSVAEDDRIELLHVDDEPSLGETVATFLRRTNDRLDVTTVAEPAAALDALEEGDFDCVVSDYEMPDMDGLELAAAVRERYGDLPFVLFTGKGSEEIASEAISAGVTDYLRKGYGSERYELLANRVVNAVEQYRASQRATLTERRLAELAERTDDVLWTFSGDWEELLFVNNAYEELYGGDLDRLNADAAAFLETVHPDDRDAVREGMATLAGGEPTEMEYRVNPDEGYERWVWVDAEPVIEDGEVVRIVGFSRDITERKRHEEAAAELHEATRELMAAESPTEIAELVVQAVEDVLGLPFAGCWFHDAEADVLRPVALASDTAALFDAPPTFEPGDSLSWEAFTTGEPRIYEDVSEVPGRHNEETAIRAEIIYPLGEFGVLNIGSLEPAVFDDIDVSLLRVLAANAEAALRRAERETAMRDERAFFDTALDALDDVFYVIDEHGRLQQWNERLVEVTGRTPEDLDGRAAPSLFVDEHRERIGGAIVEVLTEGQTIVTAEILTEDGSRPLEIRGARLTDTEGDLVGIVGVARDISERREREQELERQNRRLERFAQIVSHDLRNPLAVASGRLDLAREERDDEHLAAVGRAHDRMEQLVEDLLTLARHGDRALTPEPIPLGELVEGCWGNVETGEATLNVETDATIRADEGSLRQVVENLLRNSIEHGTTEGRADGPTVTVGDTADGFYVADDGPGIPADEREAVLEAGYTTTTEGTGLGLAIVREIAEAHGWTVRVTESDAGGARFEFGGVTFE